MSGLENGMSYGITARVQKDGSLLLTAGNETRRWMREQREDPHINDDCILYDGFEPYWANGSYQPFEPGTGEPYDTPLVGLTDAPCIAEEISIEDDGTQRIFGRVWWFPDYMVVSPINELIRHGRVVFPLGIEEYGNGTPEG